MPPPPPPPDDDDPCGGGPPNARAVPKNAADAFVYALQRKAKEADTIKVPSLPASGSHFRARELAPRNAIIAASGKEQDCFMWAFEIVTQEFADLKQPGPGFASLVFELAACVTLLGHGELG